MLESLIQSKIIKHLELHGWLVIKIIQTNKNGIMDLLALRNGVAVFIEVKQPGKKPTALQNYRAEKIIEKGFEVITAHSLNDIEKLCK